MIQRDVLRPFVSEYDRTGLASREKLLAYLLLLSRAKSGQTKWGPGGYSEFEHEFAWGSIKNGDRYLKALLDPLETKGCISVRPETPRRLIVEVAEPPARFRYFSSVADPALLAWTRVVTAEGLSLYLVLGSLCLSDEEPFEFDSSWFENRFGKWRDTARAKYYHRLFENLTSNGLLEVRKVDGTYVVVSVSDLPDSIAGSERQSFYYPTFDRPPLSPPVCARIWEADGRKCVYCGVTLVGGAYQVDHVIPLYMNGARSDERNLGTSCDACNARRKWFKDLGDPRTSDRWREVLPHTWRGRVVSDVEEAEIEEDGVQRRVPVISTGTT
ncbi:MAG: HNH endonuclease [Planctomycetes bacterium]|nr:HNH endonuclease [Planctomycetota bacterium]